MNSTAVTDLGAAFSTSALLPSGFFASQHPQASLGSHIKVQHSHFPLLAFDCAAPNCSAREKDLSDPVSLAEAVEESTIPSCFTTDRYKNVVNHMHGGRWMAERVMCV